jgi:hypothetical protein
VLNKKFQGVGRLVLSHTVEKVIFREGFVRIEDEMAVVVEGGGVFDPKIAIGDAAVAPTWKGEMGGVPIKNGA